eukprot:s2489_g5.t1
MNRRGYGGLKLEVDTARMTLYGIDEDLDEVFLEVGRRYPGRPVALVGFSCGSCFAVRYAVVRAHLSAWAKDAEGGLSKTIPRLLCVVSYDNGYCIDKAPARVPRPYCWALDIAFRYQYVFRHYATWLQKSRTCAQVVEAAMSPTRSFMEVYYDVTKLAGFGCRKKWRDKQQSVLGDVDLPCLLVNSRDDPISVWDNVEDHRAEIESNPYLALADLRRGAHGCKFGFLGFRSVGNKMIAEFVLAAASELKQARAQALKQSGLSRSREVQEALTFAVYSEFKYRYHDEPFEEQLTGEFVFQAPWESPTDRALASKAKHNGATAGTHPPRPSKIPLCLGTPMVFCHFELTGLLRARAPPAPGPPPPRATRGPSRAKRARARSQQRARQRSVGSAAAVYTASAAGHASVTVSGDGIVFKLLEDRFQLLLEEVDKRLLEQRQLLETMLRGHLPPGPATVSEEPAQVHSSSVVKPGLNILTSAAHLDLIPTWTSYPWPVRDATLAVTALTSQDLPSAGMASEKAATLTSETSRRGSTKNGALASMEASRFSKQNSYEQAVAAEQSGNFVSRRSDPKSVLRTFKAAGTRDLTATNTRVGQLLAPLVLTWQFEFFYAALILSHAGLLGAQIEWEAAHLGESPPDVMVYTHLAFTFLFMLETGLWRNRAAPPSSEPGRMSTIGVRKFFTTGEYAWNIFDLLMVSLSVVELLVDLILQD